MGGSAITGVLPVYKERGYTSNDVVARLRGILHMKKIGHTGTLDPEATGVLPVCLGRATKLVGYLTDSDKTYRCTMRLGVTTDTEDMTGTIISRSDKTHPGADEVKDALLSFKGEYDQIPPMYSAKKVNGRKLYEMAREGVVIERRPSRVYIRDISDISVYETDGILKADYTVECSKGTYIRSLCRDAGEKLGVGAAMERLERIRACGIDRDDCVTIDRIEEMMKDGGVEGLVIPIERFYSDCGSLTASQTEEKLIRNGNRFRRDGTEDGTYRVYLPDGTFAAVYEIKNGDAKLCRFFLE
jgi:tRNA pseudouridine55 synthase